MSGFRALKPMDLSDDEKYDWVKARRPGADQDPPDYPPGMCFTVREADFEALGIGDDCQPGASVAFMAMARATSVSRNMDGCRIEAEIDYLSLGDGEMVEIAPAEQWCRPCICLDQNDHERLDLDDDCSRGDMLHLIGTVRVEAMSDSEGSGRVLSLQIISCSVEDEDQETRGD